MKTSLGTVLYVTNLQHPQQQSEYVLSHHQEQPSQSSNQRPWQHQSQQHTPPDPLTVSQNLDDTNLVDFEEDFLERDLILIEEHNHPYCMTQDQTDVHTQPPPAEGLPDMATAHCTYISTAVHVPKAARALWAQVLAAVLQEVVKNWRSIGPWVQLYILARCILPARQSGNYSQSYGREVIARLRRWKKGEVSELWKEAVSEESKSGRRRQRQANKKPESQVSTLKVRNAAWANRLIQEGQYTRAQQALVS